MVNLSKKGLALLVAVAIGSGVVGKMCWDDFVKPSNVELNYSLQVMQKDTGSDPTEIVIANSIYDKSGKIDFNLVKTYKVPSKETKQVYRIYPGMDEKFIVNNELRVTKEIK